MPNKLSKYSKISTVPHLLTDHYAILVEIGRTVYEEEEHTPKFNNNRANWTKFKEILKNIDYMPIQESQDTEFCTKRLTTHLKEAAISSIPRTTNKQYINKSSRKTSKPWWNDQCQASFTAKRDAEKNFRKNPNPKTYIQFKQACAGLRRDTRKAKALTWASYLEKIDRYTPESKIHQFLDRIMGAGKKKNNIKHPLLVSGIQLEDDSKKAEALADIYQQKFAHKEELNKQRHNERLNTVYELTQPFKTNEFLQAVNKMNQKASPGEDEIHISWISNAPRNFQEALIHTFNLCYSQGVFPQQWKQAIITPVAKQGKPKDDPHSYRPIVCLPTLGKLFERMLYNRVQWYTETNNILPKYQAGFRAYHSTIDIILKLVTDAQKTMNEGLILGAVLIDLEGAYDNAQKDMLGERLYVLGFPQPIRKLIDSFLDNRTFKVKVNGKLSSSRPIEKGLPQGAVLSCLLFILYMTALKIDSPHGIFADDIGAWAKGKTFAEVANKLQTISNNLQDFSTSMKLPISVPKSVIIYFHNRRKVELQPVTLGNSTIPTTSATKYLGIILDNRLTFKPHIDHIIQSCMKKMRIIQRLCGTTWGSMDRSLLKLYTQYIRPVIEYGLIIYGTCSKQLFNKLECVQNTAIRLATGCRKTTKIQNLLQEGGLPPIENRYKLLTIRYLTKLETTPHHFLFPEARASRLEPKNHPLMSAIMARTQYPIKLEHVKTKIAKDPPWISITPEVKLEFLPQKKEQIESQTAIQHFGQLLKKEYDGYNQLYVDGSLSEDGCGSGCFLREHSLCIMEKHKAGTSILTAEVAAINLGLETLIKLKQSNKHIVVFSDSKSALNILTNPNFETLDIDLHQTKENLSSLGRLGCVIKFQYIPSHLGIEGNEKADNIAKQGAKSQMEPVKPLTIRDITRLRLKTLPKLKPSNLSPFPTRMQSVWFHRLSTNTANFNHHSFSYKIKQPNGEVASSPFCRYCKIKEETPEHILLKCKMLERKQVNLLNLKVQLGLNSNPLTNVKTLTQSSKRDFFIHAFKLLMDLNLQHYI